MQQSAKNSTRQIGIQIHDRVFYQVRANQLQDELKEHGNQYAGTQNNQGRIALGRNHAIVNLHGIQR